MASVSIDDDDFDVDNMDFDLPSGPAPSSSSSRPPAMLNPQQDALLSSWAGPSGSSQNSPKVIPTSDVGKFKHYQVIYPIYIDAKRPHKNGERRVSKNKAVHYPKAQEIAEVCGRYFGLAPVYEPEKTHPRDWANPGRVRVLIKTQDGKLTNTSIPDKYTLLNSICEVINKVMRGPKATATISQRLPFHSPAISVGTLQEAMKGGGKMQEMMNSMLGGGAAAGSVENEEEIKKREAEREMAEKQRIAKMKALQKQGRRMVVRR